MLLRIPAPRTCSRGGEFSQGAMADCLYQGRRVIGPKTANIPCGTGGANLSVEFSHRAVADCSYQGLGSIGAKTPRRDRHKSLPLAVHCHSSQSVAAAVKYLTRVLIRLIVAVCINPIWSLVDLVINTVYSFLR